MTESNEIVSEIFEDIDLTSRVGASEDESAKHDESDTKPSLPIIAIAVPCYNEESVLPLTVKELLKILDKLHKDGLASSKSYILCVDDGSSDKTWQKICELHEKDARVNGIALTHNRGHQNALLAALMTVVDHCDAAITIDADLQDDPQAIFEMVRKFVKEGKEIVYGVRSSRESDTAFKRKSAHAFYRLQKSMGIESVYDHADYRLMSRRALKLLEQYGESNVFLRGIVPHIGLDSGVVKYERKSRAAGESKYPLSKMISHSIDGVTSFSAKPMRWIFLTGLAIFIVTLLVTIYVLVSYFLTPDVSRGWASLMLSIWGLGSLILMAIGIVGEYIGKIFNEVKRRPRFAIKESVGENISK